MIRVFRHYVPKSLILLATAEASIFAVSVYVGALLRFGGVDAARAELDPLQPKVLLYTFVLASCMTAMGLYQRHLREGRGGMLLRITMAFGAAVTVMSLVFYTMPSLFLGRGVFGIAYAVALAGVFVARALFMRLADQDTLKRRILVLGTGEKAACIGQLKRRVDRRGWTVVGYVHLPGEPEVVPTDKILRPDVPLVEFANLQEVDEMVMAVEDRRKSFPVEEILDCKMSGIHVIDLLSFFERQTGRIKLDILHPSWFIFSDGFHHGSFRDFSKRVFDVSVSTLLLVLALPVIAVTAAAIYFEDRGPLFYRQVRVGQNWKLFQVMKFRSMRTDAEKHGAQWAQKNDSRVTRIGRFIRKTRIDELPQLLNVLKGDMSFVGPRPERPEFVEQFADAIPYYTERHRVKPGITGWAQICYPYGASEKDTREKLQYDLYYVKNYSLFLDMTILFQTAEVILWGKGAR